MGCGASSVQPIAVESEEEIITRLRQERKDEVCNAIYVVYL